MRVDEEPTNESTEDPFKERKVSFFSLLGVGWHGDTDPGFNREERKHWDSPSLPPSLPPSNILECYNSPFPFPRLIHNMRYIICTYPQPPQVSKPPLLYRVEGFWDNSISGVYFSWYVFLLYHFQGGHLPRRNSAYVTGFAKSCAKTKLEI